MSCDTETCETCGGETILGTDAQGRCEVCAGDTSLEHMLRLMAAGVTRDPRGRFTTVKKG